MGLTNSSTGTKILNEDMEILRGKCDYTIAIAGNPNVGKSTIFNNLTGMHQHTGNWPGKTVANACGSYQYQNKSFLLVDIPGTYSLMSNSEEEEIARNFICFGKPDVTVIVVDATCLERNLNLVYQTMEITPNIVVCVNLLDEAEKKGIHIDLDKLSFELGVPVIGTIARKKRTLKKLIKTIDEICNKKSIPIPKKVQYISYIEDCISSISSVLETHNYISRWICLKLLDENPKILNEINKNLLDTGKDEIKNRVSEAKNVLENNGISNNDLKDTIVSTILFHAENTFNDTCTYTKSRCTIHERKIDKILTSKTLGIPIMIAFLGLLFWITIVGANYPSKWLSTFFSFLGDKITVSLQFLHFPSWITSILMDGIYTTLTWVISVMLPPMAIFFPIFTILEDFGYLPRIAFNLDKYFHKACSSGKQALTMCMGFGCNAAGVIGARIIDSPREKLIAILTNCFVPCNGRFPFLITIAMIFIGGLVNGFYSSILATLSILFVVLLGIFMTLFISKLLSKTILKGIPSSFILELPPYRIPQFGKVFIRSIFDRTLFVLGRAITVAAPAGLIIWLFANLQFENISILTHLANFFEPFANLMGLDGYILTAFILGFPANEIVLPIILMSYMQKGSLVDIEDTYTIGNILVQNGWTFLTAINVMIFTLFHFPCSTTFLSIKKETNSWKWAGISLIIPTVCGIIICMCTTLIWNLPNILLF